MHDIRLAPRRGDGSFERGSVVRDAVALGPVVHDANHRRVTAPGRPCALVVVRARVALVSRVRLGEPLLRPVGDFHDLLLVRVHELLHARIARHREDQVFSRDPISGADQDRVALLIVALRPRCCCGDGHQRQRCSAHHCFAAICGIDNNRSAVPLRLSRSLPSLIS